MQLSIEKLPSNVIPPAVPRETLAPQKYQMVCGREVYQEIRRPGSSIAQVMVALRNDLREPCWSQLFMEILTHRGRDDLAKWIHRITEVGAEIYPEVLQERIAQVALRFKVRLR